jgi:hypothetical protein
MMGLPFDHIVDWKGGRKLLNLTPTYLSLDNEPDSATEVIGLL